MVRGTSSADRIDGWRDRTGPATITRTQGSLVVSGKTKPFPLWNEGEEKTSSPSFLALIMDGVEAASRVCDERRCAAPLTPLPPRWGLVSLDNANVVIDGMTTVDFSAELKPGASTPRAATLSHCRTRLAHKHLRRVSLVGRALELPISAFLRDANRGKVLRVDDAGGPHRPEVRIAPGDDGANRLGRVTFAVGLRDEDPSDFRHTLERWLQVALVVGESHLPDEIAGRLLLRHPIAETQQRPVSHIAQQPRPGLLFGMWLAADVAIDLGVGPHRGGGGEIVHAMTTELEPFGLDNWHLYSRLERTGHCSSLRRNRRSLDSASLRSG